MQFTGQDINITHNQQAKNIQYKINPVRTNECK